MKKTNTTTEKGAGTLTAKYDANKDYSKTGSAGNAASASNAAKTNKSAGKAGSQTMTSQYDIEG